MSKTLHGNAACMNWASKTFRCLMASILVFTLSCSGIFQSIPTAHAATVTHKVKLTTVDGFSGTWLSDPDEDAQTSEPGTVIIEDGEACNTEPALWQNVDDDGLTTGVADGFGDLLAEKQEQGYVLAYEANTNLNATDDDPGWTSFSWMQTEINSDLIVRGKWVADTSKKVVTVSYNDNKEHSEAETTFEYDKGSIGPSLPTPTRDNYQFDGWWYTGDDGEPQKYESGKTVINNDIDIYAEWHCVDITKVLGNDLPPVSDSKVYTGGCHISKFIWKPKGAKKQVATFKISNLTGTLSATQESKNYSPNYTKRGVCVDHGGHATETYYSQKADYKSIVVYTNKSTGKIVYLCVASGYQKIKGESGKITANGDPNSKFKITSKYANGNAKTVTYSNGKSGKSKDELTFTVSDDGVIKLKSNKGHVTHKKEQRVGFAREAQIVQTMQVKVAKDSNNHDITDGNGCYSLEDAEYGIYAKKSDADAGNGNYEQKLTTNKEGNTPASKKLKPGTYYVKELKAPKGYAKDDTTYPVSGNGNEISTVSCGDTPQNDPVNILLGKYTDEKAYDTNGNNPMGAGDLSGAEFVIQYYDGQYGSVADAEKSGKATRTWVYKTDKSGRIFTGLSSDCLIDKSSNGLYTSDKIYKNSKGQPTFPLGTYVMKEVKAPTGYLLPAVGTDASKGFCVQVTGEGTAEDVKTWNNSTGEVKVSEQIKRGDFEFVKTDDDHKRLVNIPFKVTSKTTGESHVIVTDANGQFSSLASNNAHTNNTNGNDWFMADDADHSGNGLNDESGIWFGKYSKDDDRMTDAKDDRGALPYDSYTLEELSCDANKGYTLIKTDFVIQKESQKVGLGTIVDHVPVISTTATDAVDGDKVASVTDKITIRDHVAYENVTVGTKYILKAKLMDKSTGEPFKDANGNEVTAEKEFTPAKTSGTEVMDLTFDGTNITSDTDLVVYETLVDTSVTPNQEYKHEDINDSGQTVKITNPKLSTTATDAVDGDKFLSLSRNITINDRVAYEDVVPGTTYVLNAKLMDKKTGEAFKDADGKEVTASKEFTPKAAKGTEVVELSFDGSNLTENADVVVYEYLSLKDKSDKTISSHEDINDEGQTVQVTMPELGTTATNATDNSKNAASDYEVTINDRVAYKNLSTSDTYVLNAKLMDKKTGEAFKDADGKEVTASKEFTPKDANGSEVVTLKFNSTNLTEDTDVVVYEYLSFKDQDDKVIGSHEDIDDEGQTITIKHPEIGTTAKDGLDGDKEVVADTADVATVVDTIAYKNLIPGKEYKASGTLMVKSTGKALLDKDGNEVTASTTFTPKEANGTVEVKFTFDASLLAGKELVAFEKVTRDDIEIAVHEDIDDADQTVKVVAPVLTSVAEDTADGDKKVVADPDSSITDTLTYSNVIPGKELSLAGILMDKSTGLPMLSGEGAEDISSTDLEKFSSELFDALGTGSATKIPYVQDDDGNWAKWGDDHEVTANEGGTYSYEDGDVTYTLAKSDDGNWTVTAKTKAAEPSDGDNATEDGSDKSDSTDDNTSGSTEDNGTQAPSTSDDEKDDADDDNGGQTATAPDDSKDDNADGNDFDTGFPTLTSTCRPLPPTT